MDRSGNERRGGRVWSGRAARGKARRQWKRSTGGRRRMYKGNVAACLNTDDGVDDSQRWWGYQGVASVVGYAVRVYTCETVHVIFVSWGPRRICGRHSQAKPTTYTDP